MINRYNIALDTLNQVVDSMYSISNKIYDNQQYLPIDAEQDIDALIDDITSVINLLDVYQTSEINLRLNVIMHMLKQAHDNIGQMDRSHKFVVSIWIENARDQINILTINVANMINN